MILIPLENTKDTYNEEILEHYKDYMNFKGELWFIAFMSVLIQKKNKLLKTFSI